MVICPITSKGLIGALGLHFHFHLVLLANTMLTDVRQWVQHEHQGRRGMKVDPAWASPAVAACRQHLDCTADHCLTEL